MRSFMICAPRQILFGEEHRFRDEVEKNEMEVRHIAHMGKRTNAYITLIRNPERKMPLEA
jgi:hypothetical protein